MRGYAPTAWQKSLFPAEWSSKIEVLHDGIDIDQWKRRPVPRRIAGEAISENTRIVTYVARVLESMRGFDVFMRVANRIAHEMPNVIFVIVGSRSVIQTVDPDLSRFRFLGTVPSSTLVELWSLSDLHIYLTVREIIRHGETGLLGDFFDVDGLANQALQVLREPASYRILGQAGRALIDAEYSLDRTYPRFLDLMQNILHPAELKHG